MVNAKTTKTVRRQDVVARIARQERKYQREIKSLKDLIASIQWVHPSLNSSLSCSGCGNMQHLGCDPSCEVAKITGDPGQRTGTLSENEIVRRWREVVVVNSVQIDNFADKGGHNWHSLWTGFVLGLGRGDLMDWSSYKRLGFPVEMEATK